MIYYYYYILVFIFGLSERLALDFHANSDDTHRSLQINSSRQMYPQFVF